MSIDAPSAAGPVERLGPGDAAAYKRLRDRMLAAFPDAFTSDAATERARPAASYEARLDAQAGGFTLGIRAGEHQAGDGLPLRRALGGRAAHPPM